MVNPIINRKIDVSVIMTTYGHANYIVQALDGILSQNFEGIVEILISNDKSPDNTDEILKEYFSTVKVPENFIINYVNQEKNLGALENFLWTIENVKGEYVAICEGDDFWVDNDKLTKQYKFLSKNDEYSIVFSNVNVKIEDGEYNQSNELTKVEINREFKSDEIIKDWIAHTSSFFMKNSDHFKKFPSFFRKHKFMYGDTVLFLYMMKAGKSYGITDTTSTYRRHSGGLTNQTQDVSFFRKYILHMESFKNAFNEKSNLKIIKNILKQLHLKIFFHPASTTSEKVNNFIQANKYDWFLVVKIIIDKVRLQNK